MKKEFHSAICGIFPILCALLLAVPTYGQKRTLALMDAIEIAQAQSYEAVVAHISFVSADDAIETSLR